MSHRIDTFESADGTYLEVAASRDGARVAGLVARKRRYAYGKAPVDRFYAEICSLVVDPEYRRTGIGSDLMTAVRDWATRRGYTHLAVEASAKPGTPGVPFYEAQGFTARSVILDAEVRTS